MAEPGDGDQEGRGTGRPSGAALIAEMLGAQEEAAASPAPPSLPTDLELGYERPRKAQADSKRGMVVAVLALALLLGAGLGVLIAGQGFGTTSRAAFAAKADAVCGPANGPVTALAKPTSYPELATAAATLTTATDSQLAGLRALELPGGVDGARAGAVLNGMAETNHAARSLQEAANRMDDPATAAAVRQMRLATTDASTKATELGLSACAAGMQPGVEAVIGGAAGVVRTAFLAKSDTLCRGAARDMEGVRAPRSDPRDLGRYIGALLPIVEKLAIDLRALPVPPGDEATVAEAMSSLERMNDKAKELRDAALAGDRSRFLAVDEELTIMGTAADAKLDAYGLSVCGSNFGGR
jgi:hypothetical protein